MRSSLSNSILFAALILGGGCVSTSHLAPDRTASPSFDPIAFFVGHTEGKGTLKIALHEKVPTLVEGHGEVRQDGSIELDQTVRRGDNTPTRRSWHLHRIGAGRYVGTLTDATGPVTAEADGNRLHLAFAMKGGLRVQQWMYLEHGASVVRNVMVIRKLGLPVARLEETITRMS